MTHHDDLDRSLVAWFSADATRRAPTRLVEAIAADTRTRPQLPGWLVTLRGESMGAAVRGSARGALLALVLIALIALVAALVAGGPRQPNGGLLALIRDGDVYVANADGSGARLALRHEGAKFVTVAWSPDGGRLAVDHENTLGLPDPGVVVLDVASGAVGSIGDHNPVWSPDGRQLAVLSGAPGVPQLRLVDVPTLAIRAVYPFQAIEGLAWSPNGRWIAATGGDEDRSIVRIDVATGDVVQIDGPSGHLDSPKDVSWSPDSRRIVFVRYHVDDGHLLPGCHDVRDCDLAVFVADADGSNAIRVTPPSTRSDLPQWSPDGAWLAFRRENAGISIVRADGSDERVVVSVSMGGFRWNPSGDRLRYAVPASDAPATLWETSLGGAVHSLGVAIDGAAIDGGARAFASTGFGFDWQPTR